jgi:hypothetical protein
MCAFCRFLLYHIRSLVGGQQRNILLPFSKLKMGATHQNPGYKYTNYHHRWHYKSEKPVTKFIMTRIPTSDNTLHLREMHSSEPRRSRFSHLLRGGCLKSPCTYIREVPDSHLLRDTDCPDYGDKPGSHQKMKVTTVSFHILCNLISARHIPLCLQYWVRRQGHIRLAHFY